VAAATCDVRRFETTAAPRPRRRSTTTTAPRAAARQQLAQQQQADRRRRQRRRTTTLPCHLYHRRHAEVIHAGDIVNRRILPGASGSLSASLLLLHTGERGVVLKGVSIHALTKSIHTILNLNSCGVRGERARRRALSKQAERVLTEARRRRRHHEIVAARFRKATLERRTPVDLVAVHVNDGEQGAVHN
jgi:hypothetical protein